MNILQLYLLFLKIGLFTYGGGYAMLPLFQDELVTKHQLISNAEFADIIALAQVTPGPIGLNAATYIGQQQAGTLGAMAGTLGVCTPSLIIGLLVALCLKHFASNSRVQDTLAGLRATTVGLIASAALFLADASIFTAPLKSLWTNEAKFGICWQSAIIFAAVLFVQSRWKLNVTWVMLAAGAAGAILGIF